MAGIVVDASRMHLTKKHWQELLGHLSQVAGRDIRELHTRDFYRGNGVFCGIDGDDRRAITTAIFDWLSERKHHVVFASVVKQSYLSAFDAGTIPTELNTLWRFMGFHLILALQKHCQGDSGVKGHTLFVFRQRGTRANAIH
jgi:hypothetical protein